MPSLVQDSLFARQPALFLAGVRRRYGDVFTLRPTGLGELVVIADRTLAREALAGSPETFLAGAANRRMLALCGRSSLLAADGAEQLRTRRRLAAVLHGDSLRAHEAQTARLTAERVRAWPLGRPISMHRESSAIMSETILRTVLGAHDSPWAPELRRGLAKTMDVTLALSAWYTHDRLALLQPWKGYAAAVGHVHELIRRLVIARAEEDLEGRPDMLSLLICAGETDWEWLRDQLMTLIVAGQDTTTSWLSWVVERLAHNQRAQARARESGAYLDAVLTEALRVRTVLPGAARRLAQPAAVGPYELPAGSTLSVSALLMSSDSRIYDAPSEFRPARWLDGRPGKYSWLPFGGGRRRCLGATLAEIQLRAALAEMLRHAHWRPASHRPEQPRLQLSLTPARGALIVRTR